MPLIITSRMAGPLSESFRCTNWCYQNFTASIWNRIYLCINHLTPPHFFNSSNPQRATLAEKEVNTLKEQLNSSSSISQSPKSASALAVAAAAAAQNGIIPPSLASPSSDNGALSLNSKLLNNNQIDEVNENKMDADEQQQTVDKPQNSDSNRSTPVSCEKDGESTIHTTAPTANSNSNTASAVDGHSRTLSEEIAAKDKEVSFVSFHFAT